jgi:hypothetical protein
MIIIEDTAKIHRDRIRLILEGSVLLSIVAILLSSITLSRVWTQRQALITKLAVANGVLEDASLTHAYVL